MSHKSKRHHRKKHDETQKKEMSQFDRDTIALLEIQAQAINIYLISDIFFYNFAEILLQSAYDEYYGVDNENPNPNILLVKAGYLSLIASVIISNVSFIAYGRLYNKGANGEIDYSMYPEEEITVASVYTVVLFYINLIGAIGLYERADICEIEITPYWLRLLNIQLASYGIRFVADYLTLTETLEGIELVKSKYSEKDIDTKNMQDPDAVAVTSAVLYLVQRIMLFYVSYKVYLYVFNSCTEIKDPFYRQIYLQPNKLPILGSIFGIIADIIALKAFIEIYRRNVDRPVFGR